ncbi:MAG: CoA-binding protein [bacterium]|nr:CoA-binding protein [bacterium]
MTKDDRSIKDILRSAKRIAIFGLSPNEERKSNEIARFLIDADREIVPVNPVYDEILDKRSYPDLKSVPGDIDMAVVFRAPKFAEEVLADAKASGVNRVWFQPGAFDEGVLSGEYIDVLDVYYDN